MAIVLHEMTREAADAILAGERPGEVHVADDYPTEFSAGVAQCVGAEGAAANPGHVQPQRTESPRDLAADGPEPDDGHPAADDHAADRAAPLVPPLQVVVLWQALEPGEDLGDDPLGDRRRGAG